MKNPADVHTLTKDQRAQIIDLLVDDWLETLRSSHARAEYIREWLEEGRIGYNNHTDEELVELADDAELFDGEEA